jgi:hypothetical protein
MRMMTVLLALLFSPAAAYSQTPPATGGLTGFSFGESMGFSSHDHIAKHRPRGHRRAREDRKCRLEK